MRNYKLRFHGEYIPQEHDIRETDWSSLFEQVALALIFLALVGIIYYINIADTHMAELMQRANANAVQVK